MSNDTIFKFEGCICSIISSAFILLPLFINSFRNMCCTKTGNSFHFTKHVIEQVAPVTKHIHNNSSIIFFAQEWYDLQIPNSQTLRAQKVFCQKNLAE